MFTESEIRTYAQDACIALKEFRLGMDSEDDTPFVYTGAFLVVGVIASTFPWNADAIYKRSFEAQEPVLWVYIDSSVPGASAGAWVRQIEPGIYCMSADPLDDPYGIEGI